MGSLGLRVGSLGLRVGSELLVLLVLEFVDYWSQGVESVDAVERPELCAEAEGARDAPVVAGGACCSSRPTHFFAVL